MPETQRLEIQEIGDVTVVCFRDPRITDPLDIDELGRQLYQVLEFKNCSKLVIDFSPVEFLSSATIGKLISLNRKVKVCKAALRLCNLRPEIQEVFVFATSTRVRRSRGPGRGDRVVLRGGRGRGSAGFTIITGEGIIAGVGFKCLRRGRNTAKGRPRRLFPSIERGGVPCLASWCSWVFSWPCCPLMVSAKAGGDPPNGRFRSVSGRPEARQAECR